MDTSWIGIAAPAALVGGFLLYKRMRETAPGEARRLVKEGAQLVDVRSAGEFDNGHIDGAVNIPVGELAARSSKLGAKDKPVGALLCQRHPQLDGALSSETPGFHPGFQPRCHVSVGEPIDNLGAQLRVSSRLPSRSRILDPVGPDVGILYLAAGSHS